jgi:hypothetical protein
VQTVVIKRSIARPFIRRIVQSHTHTHTHTPECSRILRTIRYQFELRRPPRSCTTRMNRILQLALTLLVWTQRSSSFTTTTASCARHKHNNNVNNNNIFGGEPCRTRLNGSEDVIETVTPDMGDVGFVLLAGGKGSRMKSSMREFHCKWAQWVTI